MRFTSFKEFKANYSDANRYLTVELPQILRDLSTGLTHLEFDDNFISFTKVLIIEANTEKTIQNELRDLSGNKIIPSKRLIVRGNQYASYVQDGPTTWTVDNLYLKNYHATGDATLTVIFFK